MERRIRSGGNFSIDWKLDARGDSKRTSFPNTHLYVNTRGEEDSRNCNGEQLFRYTLTKTRLFEETLTDGEGKMERIHVNFRQIQAFQNGKRTPRSCLLLNNSPNGIHF